MRVELLPDAGTDVWDEFVGEFGGKPTAWLVEVARTADPLTARRALAALADVYPWVPDEQAWAEAALREMIATGDRLHPGVLGAALEIYEDIGTPEGARHALALFRHPDPLIVQLAFDVMDAVGANALAAAMLEAARPLVAHSDPDVRLAAAALIGSLGDWEGDPVTLPLSRLTHELTALLGADDPAVRRHAARLMVRWDEDGLSADAALTPLLGSADPELRAAAAERLIRNGDPQAFDLLRHELSAPDVHAAFVTAAAFLADDLPRPLRKDLRKALRSLRTAGWPSLDPGDRRTREARLHNALRAMGRW
ncbi:HEAT repeat domain-containing protein [Actinocorallia sp. A-T 12471]|uniref:HEAT repeat domain-containing protein n=1 Tax=Actinocorallia sp. A-T 12471 TaxID=3089813 RepID=UPI0029D33EBA|nr:HEAT repeat domain-containing protein [Actinocorallia sp. A-T 12471]MDX6743159.1 HEAT repeat domain-containing protein [Actinocorallia sp. A-T 12471]